MKLEMSHPDDNKKTNRVTVWLTDRELLDLSRVAAAEDRKQSEMVRVMLRRGMYGTIGAQDHEYHGANSADSAGSPV